ncbi:phage major tail tube protein [Salmonella enterica]|nr:phage major tail tube protein [Salmonella enterica]EDJ6866112.1 phage tail protein [Salmonella enterica subsp. enterica serovar Newport]EBN1141715.1 phage major tail tube protein [Salmonella enterica]EDK8125427.1 phage tail protein [Salmonella enterica]EDN1972602.1 phage tail protein [Salmonella enterica]
MSVPHKIQFFTCFIDGENEIGKVTSLTLPKVTRKTENYRGGGMMGSVAVDLGLDDGALDATAVFGGFMPGVIRKYGGDIDELKLRFVGYLYTSGDSRVCEIEMRGRITEIDMGEVKQGEDTSHTYTIKNTYYKLSVDDQELIEIDNLNFIYKKDGKNMIPDRARSALGMN